MDNVYMIVCDIINNIHIPAIYALIDLVIPFSRNFRPSGFIPYSNILENSVNVLSKFIVFHVLRKECNRKQIDALPPGSFEGPKSDGNTPSVWAPKADVNMLLNWLGLTEKLGWKL